MIRDKYRPPRILIKEGNPYMSVSGKFRDISGLGKKKKIMLIRRRKYRTHKKAPKKARKDLNNNLIRVLKKFTGRLTRGVRQPRTGRRPQRSEAINALKRQLDVASFERSKLAEELHKLSQKVDNRPEAQKRNDEREEKLRDAGIVDIPKPKERSRPPPMRPSSPKREEEKAREEIEEEEKSPRDKPKGEQPKEEKSPGGRTYFKVLKEAYEDAVDRFGRYQEDSVILKKVLRWMAAGSGEKSFDDLQKYGIIGKHYRYSSKVRKDQGWAKFLIDKREIPSQGRVSGGLISDVRRKWIVDNIVAIRNAMRDSKALGSKGSKNRGLYGHQIDDLMDDAGHKNYYGTITKNDLDDVLDKLDPNMKGGQSFIYLLKDKAHPNGHWVSLFFDFKNRKEFDYYDSFGDKIPKMLETKVSERLDELELPYYMKAKYNMVKAQPSDSTMCGLYAFKVLDELHNRVPFKEATGFVTPKLVNKYKEKFGFV